MKLKAETNTIEEIVARITLIKQKQEDLKKLIKQKEAYLNTKPKGKIKSTKLEITGLQAKLCGKASLISGYEREIIKRAKIDYQKAKWNVLADVLCEDVAGVIMSFLPKDPY